MIKITSSVRDYKVNFSDSFQDSLKDNYNEGDIILIDVNVYSEDLNQYKCIKLSITEDTKSFENLFNILQTLIDNKVNRNIKLIAIGGGITQDVAGFVSSIMFRGISWMFYPTTLLAQGDSCIGGKTSINFNGYKNILGNFNPPAEIIICNDFLASLSQKQLNSGLGEMLHFYLVSSEADYEFFKTNIDNITVLTERCLEIKKVFVELDEFDKKERLVLNYGHTFGHAIESMTSYEIPHGIAVSMGIDMANFIAFKRNHISHEMYLYMNYGKKFWDVYPEINITDFLSILKTDKKNINDNIRCVLTKGPGSMFLEEVSLADLESYLTEYLKND